MHAIHSEVTIHYISYSGNFLSLYGNSYNPTKFVLIEFNLKIAFSSYGIICMDTLDIATGVCSVCHVYIGQKSMLRNNSNRGLESLSLENESTQSGVKLSTPLVVSLVN